MKVTHTKTLARKILLTFLAFVIVVSIAAIFVRSSITAKLEYISKLASNVERDQLKPQQTLLLLQQAEEDFQESLLNPDSIRSNSYKEKLNVAFNNIDTLLKNNTDTANLTSEQSNTVRLLYSKKIILSERLLVLKHNFDSLLTVYAQFNGQIQQRTVPKIKTEVKTTKNNVKTKTDTVVKVASTEKKGLFGRIKDAISNKKTGEKDVIIINNNKNTNTADLTTQKMIAADRNDFSKQLQLLQERNVTLLSMQKQLISLNSDISNELERIINDLKDINFRVADELKTMAFKNYQETTNLLNKFYLAALFLVLVFAILLIIFITQLNKSEIFLRKENERSITMAQQKMDLLLHMSHEIRNPLTAIKGFLYIFSRTTLTQRQKEMLDSIRGSSDMLLLTLNDTLDAAKMENSEFKINNDPFNPDFILNEVIESMSYSATKKNLGMDYQFKGDKHAIVIGDSFRLKQILINLLSNAIKYTAQGNIKVNAELNQENGLQVEVTDTGAGISQDQQINLFSKYYQTASSKGQVGTGLGLYICKQLIELQNGNITVKSVPDTGTTFTFYIPYQRNEQALSGSQGTENMVSLLNGISILAVDDNELNLMFLKVMTHKWNVDFHQAPTAEEALTIVKEGKIKLVLTDIQLPGMNGDQLLEAIRSLKSPLNEIPVIAVSGQSDTAGEKGFEHKGFCGFISKPFVEQDLITQLVKALDKKSGVA
ncbi:hybrid sensor histidine kinase/response regulator [Pedobacter frigoris]|uniref:histidine kinase n=1 Tax=Pedobacter frigoris TaxID=2571272 RepID=A0A4U1CHQ6_9SPHI|nr:ATP-binding protein [Pedobacter frigoris]TKC05961.1 response regulator [Pedobacter frigoris]